MKKRSVAVISAVFMMASVSIMASAAAGCGSWHTSGYETYCGTPICSDGRNLSVNTHEKQWRTCWNATGDEETKYRTVYHTGGCC